MKTTAFLPAVLILALVLLMQSLFIVDEREQVLVLQFGEPVATHEDPGLKAKIPFIQNVKVFDKRVLDLDPAPAQVILSDQKRIVVDTFARYRIVDMLEFHKSLQSEQQAGTRLSTIINSAMRSAMGKTTLAALLSEKRSDIMEDITKQVNDEVSRFGIKIVDIRIGRADMLEQTTQSIFARMRTEREREAAEFRAQGQEQAQEIRSKADKERTVLLAEAEMTAQKTRGQGDEMAIKIYADAFRRDPEFYSFYRTMEAYRQSLANNETTLILNPEGDFFRFFGDSAGKN